MLTRLSPLALLAFLVAPELHAQAAKPRPWEHESSDLPVDARLHFGHFDNGLRWVWAKNAEPKYRSYLRLHVDEGSLAEEDSERGMAHFLEHMAFNGSEHFAAGTLVEWFQRHGVAFGADLNAHTDFGETVYELDLPSADEKTLDEALLVLRDFAVGLTLDATEIEKEKGVIDGEERERDSPGFRLWVRQLHERLGETRLDDRIPIGVQATRARFTAEGLRAFYRRWYRPEHMTLILVGDIGELDPAALFAKHFGSLPRPAEPLTDEPPSGTVTHLAQRLCFFEPEVPSVTLRIEKLVPYAVKHDTAARWRAETPLAVARRIIDLRFEERVKQADAPFLSADVGSAEAYELVDGQELDVSCTPEKWKDALAVGEQELRRALEHGFQQAELDEVRADALRGLDEAVQREATRTSASLVADLLDAAENRHVPTAAATQRAILAPIYQALTVESCRAALVGAWGKGELALTALGNLDLGAESAQTLDEAWKASAAVAVEKGAQIATAEFAYMPKSGEPTPLIKDRQKVEDLDFATLRFENGVALAVKRTDFKEQQILFRVTLGEGRLTLPSGDIPLGWMAEHVFEDGGLGAHTIDELRRILAGKQASLSFAVGQESFDFGGATTHEDLLLQCALVCAFLKDAAWREDGYVQAKRQIPLLFESLAHQHQGPVVKEFFPALFSGDERFGFVPQAKLEAIELPAVRAWLAPELADAPLELAFVGDLDPSEVEQAVAATFGRLPARRALRAYDERRAVPSPKSGIHQAATIDTQVPKALVLIVFPVPDDRDVERTRRFGFLNEVLRDRLRVEVRERLGASYSPSSTLQQSHTYPGVGLLLVQAMTEPGAAEGLMEACLKVTDALARDGVKQDEVDRLREPLLKNMRDARRQNGWWLGILSSALRRPAVLDEARSQIAFFETLDAAPLSELTRGFLAREHSSTLIVSPAGAQPPAEKKGE